MLNKAEHDIGRVRHAKAIREITGDLGAQLVQAGMVLFSYGMSRSPSAERKFETLLSQIPKEVDTLRSLAADNARQAKEVESLQTTVSEAVALLRSVKAYIEESTVDGWSVDLHKINIWRSRLNKLLDEASKKAARILDAEGENIASEDTEERTRSLLKTSIACGAALNIVLAILLGFYFYKGTRQRLSCLMENAVNLARGEMLHPRLKGQDELGHLDNVFHDMADALTEAMRKERAVVNNAVEVICSIDWAGRFTAVNPAANSIWGFSPEDLLGSKCVELVAADDVSRTNETLESARANRATVRFENRIKRKDGKLVDMQWSVQSSQQERSTFCVVHDISERKELERMKQEFAAMVSHDLKTPLTAMELLLQTLQAGVYGDLSESGLKRVAMVEGGVERLINLVNRLLEVEKLEARELKLNVSLSPLSRIFSRSVGTVAALANERGVEVEVGPGSDWQVSVDEDQIVQVMINLLSNALRFAPPGSSIQIDAKDVDGQWIEVSVKDHGPGIPEAFQEVIFERFKKVSAAGGERMHGTGLGLYICKTIIEQHKGMIGVVSKEGEGSRFWFRIPGEQPAHDRAGMG